MSIITLYVLALVALLASFVFIPLILITAVPLKAVYYDSRIRKPLVWGILIFSLLSQFWNFSNSGFINWEHIIPLGIMGLAIFVVYNLYPSVAFPAVDFPEMSKDPYRLPIREKAQMAVIEYQGVTKAYPLDYLIHGHIINDCFDDRLVSLTYCALCRSIIPFDVTEIGPLYVGAMKNGNMVLADQKTQTFFQQGTFESVIGPLHPRTLDVIPFQFLTWNQTKKLNPLPQVCHVTSHDFREFQLPIPGAWRKLTRGDLTPGLSASKRDKSFPARTSVIGLTDPAVKSRVAYLKDEILARGVVKNNEEGVFLVAQDGVVNGFKTHSNGTLLDLEIDPDGNLIDRNSASTWDARGKYKNGTITSDLEIVMISDEFWYSWKFFHPLSKLIRL